MSKRLVVCCDGTWNTPDQSVGGHPLPTNVTKLALAVSEQAADGTRQCVYYHPGVGTSRWDHLRGGAFGYGLSRNVVDAYRFLVDNYEPGDELFFFGFSRGAFTARSTVGMVRNCGILRPENAARVGEAYALYRNRVEHPSGIASTLFRRAYAHDPAITFVGVWDTVGALGIPVPTARWLQPLVSRFNKRWAFHDTQLSSHVQAAFQALAIDEQRRPFAPTLWIQQPGARTQVLEQVWFCGAHCDVGGGYHETALSDIALLWMLDKARGHGLEFDPAALAAEPRIGTSPGDTVEFEIAPDVMGTVHDSRTKFYRLVRPAPRVIGRYDSGNQTLASTAEQRYQMDPEYGPSNLIDYLAVPEEVRVAQVLRTSVPEAVPVQDAPRRDEVSG